MVLLHFSKVKRLVEKNFSLFFLECFKWSRGKIHQSVNSYLLVTLARMDIHVEDIFGWNEWISSRVLEANRPKRNVSLQSLPLSWISRRLYFKTFSFKRSSIVWFRDIKDGFEKKNKREHGHLRLYVELLSARRTRKRERESEMGSCSYI